MQFKSCKCRHQFYWNGGIDISESWADVVSKKSLASYEIKSLEPDDAVEKRGKFNTFCGDSFRLYYQNSA